MRTQSQAAAGPFVTTNEQPPLAPLAGEPKYKPQDHKQGGKNQKPPKIPSLG